MKYEGIRVIFEENSGLIRVAATGEMVCFCYVKNETLGREWAWRIVEALNRDAPPLPTVEEIRGIFKREDDHA